MHRMHSAMKLAISGAEAVKLVQVGQVTNDANACIHSCVCVLAYWLTGINISCSHASSVLQ